MLLPKKQRAPIDTPRTGTSVAEKSAFMTDSESETIVPEPIVVSSAASCLSSVPKFEPVCSSRGIR